MEYIIDLIIENLFVILLILSGIFSFFGKNKNNGQNQRRTNSPKTIPKRQTVKPIKPYVKSEKAQPVHVPLEDSKQTQMERLAQSLGTNVTMKDTFKRDPSEEIQGLSTLPNSDSLTKEQKELKKQMSGNMTKKGLINGIIMSEVLGPPRARKPYRSIIEERKTK